MGGQVILMAAVIPLAWEYGPAAFGAWVLFLATTFAMPALACWRYDVAVVLPRSPRTAHAVLQACVAGGIFSTVLLAIIAVGLNAAIPASHSAAKWVMWLYFQPPLLLGNCIYLALNGLWIRQHRFGDLAISRIALSAITVAIQLLLGWFWRGAAIGLVAGTVAGQLLTTLLCMGVEYYASGLRLLSGWSLLRMIAAARRYRTIALYSVPYTLQAAAFSYGTVTVFGVMSSTAASGAYALAERVMFRPLNIIAASLGQVLFPRLAAAARLTDLEDRISRLILAVLTTFAGFAGAFGALGPNLLAALLGGSWRASGVYIAYLSIPAIFLAGSVWLQRIFDVKGRQRLQLTVELMFNIAALSGLVAMLVLSHSTERATLVYALVVSAYYMIRVAVGYRIAGFNLRPLVPAIGLAAVTYGASFALADLSAMAGTAGLVCFAVIATALGAYQMRKIYAIFEQF